MKSNCIYRLCCILIFLALSLSFTLADKAFSFYYLKPIVLEERLVKYLNGEYEGILTNYPAAQRRDHSKIERELLRDYPLTVKPDDVAGDVKKAIERREYYALYMISVSLHDRNSAIRYISSATSGIKDDGFTDSFLGLCVLNLMHRKFAEEEPGQSRREFLESINTFVITFSNAPRRNSSGYKLLEDVETRLLRRVSELALHASR